MSGRISQSYWNQYRVPPVVASNRTGRVNRNRPRESRDKAVKKQSACKIVQLDIRSAEVKQMDRPDIMAKVRDFIHRPAVIMVLYVLAAALAGGVIGE